MTIEQAAKLLDLSVNATETDLKMAFRRGIRPNHPDHHHGESQSSRMRYNRKAARYIEAYRVLLSSARGTQAAGSKHVRRPASRLMDDSFVRAFELLGLPESASTEQVDERFFSRKRSHGGEPRREEVDAVAELIQAYHRCRAAAEERRRALRSIFCATG